MRAILFRTLLCASLLLGVSGVAHAGELLTFLKQSACTDAPATAEYCNTYVDYRVGQGQDRSTAVNSGYQACAKISDSQKAADCKTYIDSRKNSTNGDGLFFVKSFQKYCTVTTNSIYNAGCEIYWMVRFTNGASLQQAVFNCDALCTQYFSGIVGSEQSNKACIDMKGRDN